jgi:hypothetical protein
MHRKYIRANTKEYSKIIEKGFIIIRVILAIRLLGEQLKLIVQEEVIKEAINLIKEEKYILLYY